MYLGVQVATLCNWATTKRYDLPYIKVGRLVRYYRSDLDRFLRQNYNGKSEPQVDDCDQSCHCEATDQETE